MIVVFKKLSKSRRRFILGIYMLLQSHLCLSQVTFDRTYDSGFTDGIFNILPYSNEFWMVMNTYPFPMGQFQVTQLDSAGNIITAKSFGDTNDHPIMFSLLQTIDGNFATGCQMKDVSTGILKGYIVKFDINGDTLWSKIIEPPSGYKYFCRYMIEISDGGFLITGAYQNLVQSPSDVLLIKTDSMGNVQWINTFGGIQFEDAFSSIETPDKGFLTLGWTRSFGFGNASNRDILLVKWDSLGTFQWYKTFGDSHQQSGVGITKTSDGNYLIATGWYDIFNPISYGEIIKIDVNGNVIWDKLFGGGSANGFWWAKEQINLDIVAVSAYTNINGKDDGWIVRVDSSGIEKWQRRYRVGANHCYFRDVQETPDGGIICAGFVFQGASGGQDGWLVKLDSTGCLSASNCGVPTGLFDATSVTCYDISFFPNPVKDQAVIKIDGLPPQLMNESYRLRVYDLQGRLVQSPETGFLVADTWIQCIFKRGALNSGVYLLEVSTFSNERLGMVKVVVE